LYVTMTASCYSHTYYFFLSMIPLPLRSTLFPYTTLFRSKVLLTACLQALASWANHLWYFPPNFCMETSCQGWTKAETTRTSIFVVRASQAAYSIGSVPPEAGVQEIRMRNARLSEFSGIKKQRQVKGMRSTPSS